MPETLGTRLRRRRKECGLSQAGLASLVTVDQPTISKIEVGERKPSLETLQELAGALDTTVGALVDGTAEKVAG